MTSEIRIELSVEESVFNQCDEPLLLALTHLETLLVHGIVVFISYVALDDERDGMLNRLMSRKRGADQIDHAVRMRTPKSFECYYCHQMSSKRYLIPPQGARILEAAIKPKNCELCQFRTIYPCNLKRHYARAHHLVTVKDDELSILAHQLCVSVSC